MGEELENDSRVFGINFESMIIWILKAKKYEFF